MKTPMCSASPTWKLVISTTSSHEAPASASTVRTFSKACVICTAGSGSRLPSGDEPTWPEQWTFLPTRTAGEKWNWS